MSESSDLLRRTPQRALRRVGQTLTTFRNGPKVLADLALAKTPLGTESLVYKTRTGIRIECPNADGARVPVYELFAEDAYRFAELTEGLAPDFTVLDIGGQVGCFSVSLASSYPKCTINTYEASPTTVVYTRRNVSANGLSDRVTVHGTALSDHEGTLDFVELGTGSGINSMVVPAGSQANTIAVPCTTFGSAIKDAGGVDLVKIDTEGAEYPIVLGSDPDDWASVQRVVIEYHPVPGHHWDELAAFFANAGLTESRHEHFDTDLGTVWLRRS